MTVTFCGHREITEEDRVRTWLEDAIRQAIAMGADRFLLGGSGAFDRMAADIIWEFKKAHPHIRSILVLPYLNQRIDIAEYDGTEYPLSDQPARQRSSSHRNKWMVDSADLVVACVTHGWGDAAAALRYAMRKRKRILRYSRSAKAAY